MLMNITQKIREAMMLFQMETNLRATRLYLGRFEDALLTEHCRPFARFDTEPVVNRRRRWEGMEIFVVDCDDHLAVGNPDFPPDPRKA